MSKKMSAHLSLEIQSTKYYARLCALIIREGTRCVRNYTKNNLPNGGTLPDLLKHDTIHKTFTQLRMRRAITVEQYKTLYPDDGGEVRESAIDLSLWVILARNLTANRELIDWGKIPQDHDDLKPHHILRIRNARNKLYHMSSIEINLCMFETLWANLTKSLRVLGCSTEEIEKLKTQNLDPDMTRLCVYEVKQQALDEKCSRLQTESKHRQYLIGGILGTFIVVFFMLLLVFLTLFVKANDRAPLCEKAIITKPTSDAWVQYMPREGWGAEAARITDMDSFIGPVDYFVISHTAISGICMNHEQCCGKARFVQELNMHKHQRFSDIAFSYLVGGDGVIYEGRGTSYIPATARGFNTKSLSIAFIGLYTKQTPAQDALDAVQIFIQHLVDQGALSRNTTVLGLCQVNGKKFPKSPGRHILEKMVDWKGQGWKWRPTNIEDCEGMNYRILDKK